MTPYTRKRPAFFAAIDLSVELSLQNDEQIQRTKNTPGILIKVECKGNIAQNAVCNL